MAFAQPTVQHEILRTRMCNFHLAGKCRKGAECTFAHSPEDLQPVQDLFKTRPCAAFGRKGTCIEGSMCRFAHGDEDLRSPVALKEEEQKKKREAQQQQRLYQQAARSAQAYAHQMPMMMPPMMPPMMPMMAPAQVVIMVAPNVDGTSAQVPPVPCHPAFAGCTMVDLTDMLAASSAGSPFTAGGGAQSSQQRRGRTPTRSSESHRKDARKVHGSESRGGARDEESKRREHHREQRRAESEASHFGASAAAAAAAAAAASKKQFTIFDKVVSRGSSRSASPCSERSDGAAACGAFAPKDVEHDAPASLRDSSPAPSFAESWATGDLWTVDDTQQLPTGTWTVTDVDGEPGEAAKTTCSGIEVSEKNTFLHVTAPAASKTQASARSRSQPTVARWADVLDETCV